MPRAIGANSKLHMAVEAAYGTPPSGDWRLMPFVSCDLGAEQPFIDADVIGLAPNRDVAPPFRDIVTVQGQAVVPVDLEFIGDWLTLLLGPPTSSGADPDFEHVFVSGASPLPSASIELAYPDVPSFDVIAGVRADTCEIDFSPSGAATATFGLIGQGSTRSATSAAGTPTTRDYVAFNKAQGSIRRNGASLAQITGGRLTYSNGAEIVRTIRDDLKIEGVDPGLARATGQITSRFESTLLLDDAANNAALEVAFEYRISATRRLTVTLHETYLALAKTPIQGPAGIEAAFEFRAAFNPTAGRMMTATLRNGVESYV
ncbi:phage tail tube protein [Elioraea sp.]|uniref:phage tail tube protein n=1 Tax=Elioraea sp. TaxID=2185103 RepID=UPI003F70BD34